MIPRIESIEKTETRGRIAEAGRNAVGLRSTGPDQELYEEWLFWNPEDSLTRAYMADHMWACGLHARACMHAARVTAPEFDLPYHLHMGQVTTWIANVAKRYDAYVSCDGLSTAEKFLDAGDILVVKDQVHVIVVTDVDEDGVSFTTSEGGVDHHDPETGEHGMQIVSRHLTSRVVRGTLQVGTPQENGGVKWGRFGLYKIDAGQLMRDDE